MPEVMQDNWILAVVALIVAVLMLGWLLAASRRTKVNLERKESEGAIARRNQALIDAPPAAAPPPGDFPPPTPEGLAGVGEAVAAGATPAPLAAAVHDRDDLGKIKGVGPRLVQQLHALGVTRFEQIAAWDDADIDRIDAQLGRFQGRIRRDDWRTQAGLLGAGDTAGYEAKFGKL